MADPSGADPPKDRREKKPKDSEFYEIPPDLREEYDNLMADRMGDTGSSPRFESATRAQIARQKYAKLSVFFGVVGGILLFLGPLLAVLFGVLAKKKTAELPGGGPRDPDLSSLGIILGVLMLVVNIIVLVVILS